MKKQKMNLAEATQLALLGNLNLTENVNVNIDDTNVNIDDDTTVINTDSATVTIVNQEPVNTLPTDSCENSAESISVDDTTNDMSTEETPADDNSEVKQDDAVSNIDDIPSIDTIVNDDTIETDVAEQNTDTEDSINTDSTEEDEVVEGKKMQESVGDCTFTLKINCNNDAFDSEEDNGPVNEVKRILTNIADTLEYTDSKSILDINGNIVGTYGFGFDGVTDTLDESKQTEATLPEVLNEARLNFKKYGIERAPQFDFSDDGNRFKFYMCNDVPISYLKSDGEVYLAIRPDYFSTYIPIEDLPSYKDCDKYNGVPENKVDLADVVDICKRIRQEYDDARNNKQEDSDENLNESKPKFSSKSFNEALTKYFKNNYKTIESVKVNKATKTNNGIVLETVLTNIDDIKTNLKLEMKKVQNGKSFTKYVLSESNNKLLESKDSNKQVIMMTNTNKDNVLECKYVIKK